MQIWSRRGADFTYRLPTIAEAARGLSVDDEYRKNPSSTSDGFLRRSRRRDLNHEGIELMGNLNTSLSPGCRWLVEAVGRRQLMCDIGRLVHADEFFKRTVQVTHASYHKGIDDFSATALLNIACGPELNHRALLPVPLHVLLRKGIVPDPLRATVYFAVPFLLILGFGNKLRVQHIRLF